MRCEYCGGAVEWQGPFSELTHTLCLNCGRVNCQEVTEPEDEAEDEAEDNG